MEEKKKSNVGLIILVVVLLLACAGMGVFIFINKDKLTAKESTSQIQEKEESKNTTETEVQKGACPLYKFEQSYALTEEDKQDIADSIESMDSFGNGKIDVSSITITNIDNYLMTVSFNAEGSTDKLMAHVYKVNQKFKVETFGSGTTKEDIESLTKTLSRICS